MLKHALIAVAVGAITVSTAVLSPTPTEAQVNVYTTPGRHVVDGREWNTVCAPYDKNITRCRAEIKSGGKWVFNNLTYLTADRKLWFDNPIARPGAFSSGGRDWVTSCNDDWTGKTACRSFIKSGGKWVFNNLVYFTPSTVDYPQFTFTQSTGKLTASATSTTRRWALGRMPLYYAPSGGAASGFLAEGEATIITQRTNGELSEVFHNGAFRWVQTDGLLVEGMEPPKETQPPKEDPVGQGSLNHGSSTGLDNTNANTTKVIRHIWSNFSEIKTMYGWRRGATPDHPAGRAVDVMIPSYRQNNALGWQIAKYYREHASEFGIDYIIFDQKIWSVARNSQGWRSMSDRGGDTANHKDHVHVNTYHV